MLSKCLTRVVLICSFVSVASSQAWGPAAFAQSDRTPTPEETDQMSDPDGMPSSGLSTVLDGPEAGRPVRKKPTVKAPSAGEWVKPANPARVATPASKPKAKPAAKLEPKPEPKPAPVAAVQPEATPQPAAVVAPVAPKKAKRLTKPTPKPKSATKSKPEDATANPDDDQAAAEPAGEGAEPESIMTVDPVKRGSTSRELAIRVVGLSKISVSKQARTYVPKDTELRLVERLVQDLAAKTYFEPQAIDGNFDLKTRAPVLAAASKKAAVDGVIVFEIGLEEIHGYLASAMGRRIRSFNFKYRVGEMEEKNAVSILANRIVEGLVQAIPYRGFVTSVDKSFATINLGSNHGLKEGDILELFEFRRPNFNSPQRLLSEVQVKKVVGPSESQVAGVDGESKIVRIEPFAKISFKQINPASYTVNATDRSVVKGRWWFGFGGEVDSLGAEAAAPQYESRVFKVTSAPFGYITAGNETLTLRAAFGGAVSDSETLGLFDTQATYSVYQSGGAQSAWTLAAGARVFYIRVTPNPGLRSALETTTIVSPMAEFKYQYVPRGRIRLIGTGEVFWPIYTNGASIGAMPFAFGGGAGAGIQLSITPRFGFEVFGKLRYQRRPIDGQSGVQERQSVLGTGLLLSF